VPEVLAEVAIVSANEGRVEGRGSEFKVSTKSKPGYDFFGERHFEDQSPILENIMTPDLPVTADGIEK
jgi:hypothetical protein